MSWDIVYPKRLQPFISDELIKHAMGYSILHKGTLVSERVYGKSPKSF